MKTEFTLFLYEVPHIDYGGALKMLPRAAKVLPVSFLCCYCLPALIARSISHPLQVLSAEPAALLHGDADRCGHR